MKVRAYCPNIHTAKQKWRNVPEIHSAEAITKIAHNRGGVAALLSHNTGAQFGGRTDRRVLTRSVDVGIVTAMDKHCSIE